MVRYARGGRSGGVLKGRTQLRLALLGLPLLALGVGLGCLGQAERTYFDNLTDGSADGTTVTHPEASAGFDASTSDGGVTIVDDAESDAGDVGDALSDANPGPMSDADAADAADAAEVGCGPTNTTTNCGACGVACDTTHSSPSSCTGATCQYGGCDAGWGDCVTSAPNTNGCETPLTTTSNCTGCGIACDTTHSVGAACGASGCTYTGCQANWRSCSNTAPNADGCECNSPGCCEAGACEPQHDNGVGQSYFDCTQPGQYSSALALKACIAYTDAAAQCVGYPCADPSNGPIICSAGALNKFCMCWSYSGNNIGLVDNAGQNPGTNGAHCFCPDKTAGDTPWN